MKISLIVFNKRLGIEYNLSNIVEEVKNDTQISSYAGKLEFRYHDNPQVQIFNGDIVTFKIDDNHMFSGFVFKVTVNGEGLTTVLAYDCLRYFKNNDFLIIQDRTVVKDSPKNTIGEVFATCCMRNGLKADKGDIDQYMLSPYIFNGNTYFEIMEHCIDELLANKGIWYFIRAKKDVYDTAEIKNIRDIPLDEPILVVSDNQEIINSYEYSRSIDSDTYNQIRYTKEVDEGEGSDKITKRYHYMVFNQASINEWGTLQYFENLNDSSLTVKQIEERAANMLKLKNRETLSFKITLEGSKYVFAGSPIYLNIKELEPYGFKNGQLYIVDSCTHTIKEEIHTMDLTLLVVE